MIKVFLKIVDINLPDCPESKTASISQKRLKNKIKHKTGTGQHKVKEHQQK